MFFGKLRVSHGMVLTIPWPHVIFLDFGWSWFFRWIGLVDFSLDWIGWFFRWIGLVDFFVGLDWLVFILD